MTMVLRSTPTLTFEQYRFYLNTTELLNSLEATEVGYNAFDIDLVIVYCFLFAELLMTQKGV